MKHNTGGFTLIEILLVVAAIAILAGIVILAINPAKQLGDTRNAQRQSDTTTILNALWQYSLDHNGNFPANVDSIPETAQMLGTAGSCDSGCTATSTVASCVDLSSYLEPTYLVGIPYDPTTGTSSKTYYYLNRYNNGRLAVGACTPENGVTIIKTR